MMHQMVELQPGCAFSELGVQHSAALAGLTVSPRHSDLTLLDTNKDLPGIGTFQEYYQINLLKQYPPSEISGIPSLQIFVMFAMIEEKA
jgi:hypothetical protein